MWVNATGLYLSISFTCMSVWVQASLVNSIQRPSFTSHKHISLQTLAKIKSDITKQKSINCLHHLVHGDVKLASPSIHYFMKEISNRIEEIHLGTVLKTVSLYGCIPLDTCVVLN